MTGVIRRKALSWGSAEGFRPCARCGKNVAHYRGKPHPAHLASWDCRRVDALKKEPANGVQS